MLTVLTIKARCECNGCGTPHEIVLDPASRLGCVNPSLFDFVERSGDMGLYGVPGNQILICDDCKDKLLAHWPDPEDNPSVAEILRFLEGANFYHPKKRRKSST